MDSNLGECSICLNKIENDFYKTDCNHIFHSKCYEKWMNYNTNCPLCRTENEYTKFNHSMDILFIEKYLTIPVRNFQINLDFKNLMFDYIDFRKLFKSAPVLWNENKKLNDKYSLLEPVFKLGNIYIYHSIYEIPYYLEIIMKLII